jgi:hypothetical protein
MVLSVALEVNGDEDTFIYNLYSVPPPSLTYMPGALWGYVPRYAAGPGPRARPPLESLEWPGWDYVAPSSGRDCLGACSAGHRRTLQDYCLVGLPAPAGNIVRHAALDRKITFPWRKYANPSPSHARPALAVSAAHPHLSLSWALPHLCCQHPSLRHLDTISAPRSFSSLQQSIPTVSISALYHIHLELCDFNRDLFRDQFHPSSHPIHPSVTRSRSRTARRYSRAKQQL